MKVFQPYRLDTVNYCLWRAEKRVPITPKAFDVLRYLVEHSERLVTPDEILEALWPETYVNPEVVKKYVLEIRKVLGDRPDKPVFIETSPRRGYRFVAPVSDDNPASASQTGTDPSRTIVGRQAALAGLDSYLSEALRGQRQVVFVTGDAGIGKTTLVDAFLRRAVQDSKLRFARGHCVEGFGGKEAYYPMLEAFGQLISEAGGSPVARRLTTVAPTWLIQFPSLVQPEQREMLQREILGATRERMVREICEALEAMTVESPLVLILEDLHWADPSTLDVISALARRRNPARLMLVATYRPVEVVIAGSPLKVLKHDLLIHRLCEEIALEALGETEIAQYLGALFEGPGLPAGLARLIYQHSGGNTLFVTLMVQEMVKKGLIARDQEIWALTMPLEEIDPGVPDTLQEILRVQFAQLSVPEQLILKTASVAGEYFSVWAITSTVKIEPDHLEDLCEGLAERQQFIRAAGFQEYSNGVASPRYAFKHSLYRQVLYRGLSDVTRSKLHRSLGQRLSTECSPGRQELASELGSHFEEGREFGEAVHYWILAAENAVKRFAHRDSIHVLQHALKLVPMLAARGRVEPEIQLLQRIGDAHYALGAMSDSAVAYETAAARAAQAGLKAAQARALACLSVPAWYNDPERGNAVSEQAREVSRNCGDSLLLAQTELALASCRLLYDKWRNEDAETCARADKTIRGLGGPNIPGYAFYAYVQIVQGHYRQALKQADALMIETASATDYLLALGAKTAALLHLGRFGEVLRIVQRGREMAEKNGEDAWVFIFREAWLRTLCFDFDEVRRLSKIIMRSNAEQHAVQPRTIALVASGYAELDQEKYDQALQCFSQVRNFQTTPRFFLHWRWRMAAQLGSSRAWLKAGNVTNARREADGLLESALSTADPELHALAWEMKSRVAMAETDGDGAEQYLQRALEILENSEAPLAAWRVHATAWDLYGSNNEVRGKDHLRYAQELILNLANSFEPGERLRDSFLTAAQVARVMDSVSAVRKASP